MGFEASKNSMGKMMRRVALGGALLVGTAGGVKHFLDTDGAHAEGEGNPIKTQTVPAAHDKRSVFREAIDSEGDAYTSGADLQKLEQLSEFRGDTKQEKRIDAAVNQLPENRQDDLRNILSRLGVGSIQELFNAPYDQMLSLDPESPQRGHLDYAQEIYTEDGKHLRVNYEYSLSGFRGGKYVTSRYITIKEVNTDLQGAEQERELLIIKSDPDIDHSVLFDFSPYESGGESFKYEERHDGTIATQHSGASLKRQGEQIFGSAVFERKDSSRGDMEYVTEYNAPLNQEGRVGHPEITIQNLRYVAATSSEEGSDGQNFSYEYPGSTTLKFKEYRRNSSGYVDEIYVLDVPAAEGVEGASGVEIVFGEFGQVYYPRQDKEGFPLDESGQRVDAPASWVLQAAVRTAFVNMHQSDYEDRIRSGLVSH